MNKELNTFHTGRYLLRADFSADSGILAEMLNVFLRMPLLPQSTAGLTEYTAERSIYSEAIIEGNPATLDQVLRMVQHSRENFTQDTSAIKVINISEAHKLVESSLSEELTPELITAVHGELTKGLPNIKETAGNYRNGGVKADIDHISVDYTPPASTLDINFLMKNLCQWLNEELIDANPVLRALLLHLHLKKIQPYTDANGHTARMMELWMLRKSRIKHLPYMLPAVYAEDKEGYYQAVSEFYTSSDISPFISYISEKLRGSVEDARDRNYAAFEQMITDSKLKNLLDAKVIIKRQYDFLCMLRDSGQSFRQEDLQLRAPYTKLYGKVSRTTVARDIKKYEELGLISPSDGGYIYNKDA